RALQAKGFSPVIVPAAGFDSEALLACPELAGSALNGKTVILFKGEGGRDLLAATLSARGARVLPAPCYRRLPPAGDVAQLLTLHASGKLSGLVVSSSEAVRHLGALVPPAQRGWLENTVIFCSHLRIAAAARAIGCKNICLTAPGDAGILAGLSEYNWPSK
ncbi:MAG TPA: uroporphyrinogen-III synthase, partial [Rhodocyclaceae bacterium]|nr:uroporphyrinogen-III synthase [Rhodocyclaceae bacterium]